MAAIGSAGDVFPFIAIGQALAARGHSVEVQASPWFAPVIDAAGLGFVAAGTASDYERVVGRAELWHPRRGFALLMDELAARLPDAHAAALTRIGPRSVLVGSTLAWHLRLIQEQHGLALATVHLSPTCIFSAEAPAVLPGLGNLAWLPPRLVRVLLSLVERLVLDPTIARRVDPIRASLGLLPVRRVMSHWLHSPDLVIAAWPAWFGPAQSDWPARAMTTGFPRFDRGDGAALDPSLAHFLDAGPPPVGITPGSAMAHGRAFFAKAIAACEALGQRAVLITPYAEQLPARLPANCHHVAKPAFERLVPRLAALVHHGGIGTCAQAFAAGVPQLIGPFAHDQFDNAARVQRLGAGRWVRQRTTTSGWTKALKAVVGDARIAAHCDAIASGLAEAPVAALQIAARLEALA